jgi:hypothetical protein
MHSGLASAIDIASPDEQNIAKNPKSIVGEGVGMCKEERDPFGLPPDAPGCKLDDGKLIAGELLLSFPRAIRAIATIATYGAKKYSRHGFLSVPNAEVRYLDAMMRHLLAYGAGEIADRESGLPHLHHALWNIAAIIEIGERQEKSPD